MYIQYTIYDFQPPAHKSLNLTVLTFCPLVCQTLTLDPVAVEVAERDGEAPVAVVVL